MNIEELEFSTRPFTLREHILIDKWTKDNSWESLYELLLSRTSLTSEEALNLDDGDLGIVMTKLSEAITAAVALLEIAKGLDDA